MLLKLASERPSKVPGARLSIDTRHCTALRGKRPSMRNQDRVNGSCINLKNWSSYLLHQGPLGLLDGDRHLMGGATRIPGLPQSSSMAISGAGAPLPLGDWGHSHFQWPVCLQTVLGPGGSFWDSWAQWPVDLHLKHSPLLVSFPDWWLNLLAPFGLLWGCRAWLTAMAISLAWTLACLFSCWVLSSSSVYCDY